MVYDFHASPFGTSFWPAHSHSEAADDIYGPLITEELEGLFPHFYDEERIIILSDHYDRTSWQEQIVNLEQIMASVKEGKQAGDADPDLSLFCVYDESQSPTTPSCSSTADGKGFNLNFQPGKTYRLHLICPAQVKAFLFSIDEHEKQIASLDMSPVDGGHWVKSVQLFTGQRVDILVHVREGIEPGKKFWVRAERKLVAMRPNLLLSMTSAALPRMKIVAPRRYPPLFHGMRRTPTATSSIILYPGPFRTSYRSSRMTGNQH